MANDSKTAQIFLTLVAHKSIKEYGKYISIERAEYAVMIDGDWGSGKTYFLTHSLMRIMETIDIGKDKRRKYAYVSLYGAKSIDEVSKEIVFQCFGKKNNDYGYEIVSEAKEMVLSVKTEVPDEKLETYADKELYVVIGYDDVCDNGNYEAILYGVYSTEQLAREAAEELLELGNIHHYEIECPKLDEFGWR